MTNESKFKRKEYINHKNNILEKKKSTCMANFCNKKLPPVIYSTVLLFYFLFFIVVKIKLFYNIIFVFN